MDRRRCRAEGTKLRTGDMRAASVLEKEKRIERGGGGNTVQRDKGFSVGQGT